MADSLTLQTAFPIGFFVETTYELRGTPSKINLLRKFNGSADPANDGLWYSTGITSDADWARVDTLMTGLAEFVGTDGLTDGESGIVPAPLIADDGLFLKADGTWGDPGSGGVRLIATESGTDVNPADTIQYQGNFLLGETPAGTGTVFWRGMLGGHPTGNYENMRGLLFEIGDFSTSTSVMGDGEGGLETVVSSRNQLGNINDGTTTVTDVRTLVFNGSEFEVSDNGGNEAEISLLNGPAIGLVKDGVTSVFDVIDILFNGTDFDVVDLGSGAIRVDYVGGGGSSGIVEVTDGTTTVNPADKLTFEAANFDVVDQGSGDVLVNFVGGGGGGGGNFEVETIMQDSSMTFFDGFGYMDWELNTVNYDPNSHFDAFAPPGTYQYIIQTSGWHKFSWHIGLSGVNQFGVVEFNTDIFVNGGAQMFDESTFFDASEDIPWYASGFHWINVVATDVIAIRSFSSGDDLDIQGIPHFTIERIL